MVWEWGWFVARLISKTLPLLTQSRNLIVYETERSIQNPKWMHQACSKLCNMSVAAFEVLLLSKDLLNDIMAATTGEYRSTLKNGFASLASVCGAASSGGILAQAMSTGAHVGTGLDATSGIFLFASSVAALAASRTWNSFKRSKSLRSEHLRLHAGMYFACRNAG